MAAAPIGFEFRERMAGPLSAGVDDPRQGAQRGRSAGTAFIADLHVSIADLAACVRDPQHAARLTGTATFPGLATAQPLHDGQLLLYVPDAAGRAKLMRYRFGFRSDAGAEYFLDGTKVLHTPGASPREQVTLYTQIGSDGANGASVAAFVARRELPAGVDRVRLGHSPPAAPRGCERSPAVPPQQIGVDVAAVAAAALEQEPEGEPELELGFLGVLVGARLEALAVAEIRLQLQKR